MMAAGGHSVGGRGQRRTERQEDRRIGSNDTYHVSGCMLSFHRRAESSSPLLVPIGTGQSLHAVTRVSGKSTVIRTDLEGSHQPSGSVVSHTAGG